MVPLVQVISSRFSISNRRAWCPHSGMEWERDKNYVVHQESSSIESRFRVTNCVTFPVRPNFRASNHSFYAHPMLTFTRYPAMKRIP